MADSVTIKIMREVSDNFWHEPLRSALTGGMLVVHEYLSLPAVVPIDDGHLRDAMALGAGGTYVDPSTPPKFARVGPAKGSKTAQYGAALDDPSIHPHYPKWQPHYSDGPRQGEKTDDWLSDSVDVVENTVIREVGAVFADALMKAWKNG